MLFLILKGVTIAISIVVTIIFLSSVGVLKYIQVTKLQEKKKEIIKVLVCFLSYVTIFRLILVIFFVILFGYAFSTIVHIYDIPEISPSCLQSILENRINLTLISVLNIFLLKCSLVITERSIKLCKVRESLPNKYYKK